ncbi:MAG: hypothetical protein IPM82_14870 [Saprospiraceae bacterium]|nr:hypothetical protein [Saprospiraceae bacterium]
MGAASRTDGLQFQYNQSTTAIDGAGTWTAFTALDYFNPGQATGSGSMQHSALISASITGLSIAPGATFCLRWNDFNATGADDGMAVDDFMLSDIVVPAPCTITVTFLGSPSACNDNGTPNDPNDDFFTQDVRGVFFNRPSTDSLRLVPGGDQIGSYAIHVGDIVGNQHIFNNVKFKADGTPTEIEMHFTAEPTCIDAATGPTVMECSEPCTITVTFLGSPSACNDNGTPNDPNDDFFTQDVQASFSTAHLPIAFGWCPAVTKSVLMPSM